MSTIDVYLKKRFDLIPNLVETVKGYAKHESETLEKVVAARNVSMGAKTAEEKMAAALEKLQNAILIKNEDCAPLRHVLGVVSEA